MTLKSLKDYIASVEKETINEALTSQMPIPVVGKAGEKTGSSVGFLHVDDTSPAGKALSQALGNLAKDKKAQIVVPASPGTTAAIAQQKPGTAPTAMGGAMQQEAAEDNPESAMLEAGKKNSIWVYNKIKDKYYGPFDSKSMALELHPKAPGIEYKELPSTVRNPRSVQASMLRAKNAGKVGAAGEFGKALEEKTMNEKWAGDAEVKATGEYSNKTVEQLKSMLAKLHKSGPHKAGSPEAKKQRQINFALRAKGGWKKGEGAAMKEAEMDESALQAYLGKKKYGEEGMKALQKAGREGASKEKMAKIRAQHDKLDEVQVDEKAKNPYAIGMAQAMKSTGDKPPLKKSTIVKAHDIAKSIKKKEKTDEAERPSDQADFGAGLGAGRSNKVLEASKPDFLDLDKDGNKKESMKKAAADKKKKQVKEAMNTLEAAYHEGKSHGLSKHSYACRYDEGSEEHRRYHEGFKEGLDECYGLQPNRGLVVGETGMPAATVPGMAQQAMPAMEADMEEGNAFTAKLASTPKGGSFSLGGKTYKDTSSIEEADMFAFESLDQQLNDLLNESTEEVVSEGMSVSVTQGMENMDDTVNVSATDKDADALLNFVKTVALAGGEAGEVAAVAAPVVSDYGAPKFAGHDDMAALIKKVGGAEDFAPEEKHGEPCNECGMTEEKCGCGESKQMVDEVESEDQMEYEVAEANAPDSEEAEHTADEDAEAAEDAHKPAGGGAVNEGGDGAEAGASDAAAAVDAADAAEEEEEAMSESSFASLFKKLSMIAEESTAEKDEKAEKAGKKVTKDIEYDDKKDEEEKKLDEWANDAGKKGTDASFERDIEFMTKIISGGLNKPKSTGQTTVPVIAGQEARMGEEDVSAWKKLAGLSK